MTTELTLKVKSISLENPVLRNCFKNGYLQETPYTEMLEGSIICLVETQKIKNQNLTQYQQRFGSLDDLKNKDESENQLKADAISEFVNLMIGAFESGFIEKNNPTLAEIHIVAHHHVKDNYGIQLPGLVEVWGKETAQECARTELPIGVYPLLKNAISIMGHDNNMSVKHVGDWPDYIDYDYLENEVGKLSKEELDIFVTGETTEISAIEEKHKCHQLNKFLNSAFDGDLNEHFYL